MPIESSSIIKRTIMDKWSIARVFGKLLAPHHIICLIVHVCWYAPQLAASSGASTVRSDCSPSRVKRCSQNQITRSIILSSIASTDESNATQSNGFDRIHPIPTSLVGLTRLRQNREARLARTAFSD